MKTLTAKPLTKEAFSEFGDVIEKTGSESFLINNGNCRRHHSLTQADVTGANAQVIISIFEGTPYALPHTVDLVERHPLGSQAFYPLGPQDWLVIACSDENGTPVNPQAFLASGQQGINLRRGVWHGVLTPLYKPSDFLVVDRGGEGNNLEEYQLPLEQQFRVAVNQL